MGFKSTPEWECEAIAIADTHPVDYAEMDAWLRVMDARGIEGKPIASVDLFFAVFQFETKRLCVLAVRPRDDDPILTHIFVRGGPKAVDGRVNRARVATRAIGHTAMMIA